MTVRETVAFIGLGRMGLPMAGRLAGAGHEVRGYDLSDTARSAAADLGISVSTSVLEAVAPSRIVITMLPDPPAVERCAEADNGVLAGIGAGDLWMEMTSSDPAVTRRMAEECAARGGALLDAPVSGGVRGAREGALTIACAGSADVLARAEPILRVVGANVVHVSERPGDGDLAKTINNLLSAINLSAAGEGLALAMAHGLDGARLVEYISGSSGSSNAAAVKLPRHVLSGKFDADFTLGQYVKDLRIAMSAARAAGIELELAPHAVDLWEEFLAAEGPEVDHTTVVRLLATRAGIRWPIVD